MLNLNSSAPQNRTIWLPFGKINSSVLYLSYFFSKSGSWKKTLRRTLTKSTLDHLARNSLVRGVGHFNAFVIVKNRCYTKNRRLESIFYSLFTAVVIAPTRFKFRLALCVSFCLCENMKRPFKTVNFNSREEIFISYYIGRSDRCWLSWGYLGRHTFQGLDKEPTDHFLSYVMP